MGDNEPNMETIERAFNGCATCGHPYASHTRTDGGCGVMMVPKYRCSCTQYAAPVAVPDGLTDLPDDVVNVAAEAIRARGRQLLGPQGPGLSDSKDLAITALAAASGPWAEQLDAAKAEPCEMPHPSHPEWLCERPKGHDAHRRPGDAWCTDQEAWVELQSELTTLRVRDEHYEILLADNLALRAELDNLRETLAQKVEAEMRRLQTGSEAPEFDEGMAVAAAIVRGSGDE